MKNLNLPLLLSFIIAVSIHVVLFLALNLSPSLSMVFIPKKLLVSTVRLNPEKILPDKKIRPFPHQTVHPEKEETPQTNVHNESVHQSKPQKKEKPKPTLKPQAHKKKETLKKETLKKPAEKKPTLKPAVDHKKIELIAKAQESLKKIEREKLSLTTVAAMEPLQSRDLLTSETLSESEVAYRDELAQLLRVLLRLPELGEINLKLTIAKSGAIKIIEILSSESSSNRNYVEKTLPQHTMPPLGKQFGNMDSYTFTITMKGV